MINVMPAKIRITFSICVIALKYLPNFSKLNAITNANKITGNPVPSEKAIGKCKPDFMVKGINIPKNNAPL